VDAVILERHGAVAVGPDPAVAVDRLELIEVLCRTWLDALLVRAARARLDEAAIVSQPDNRPATHTEEG
jgi:ribulose-5-phosphate 4-epimerase/fuculose-1-phosphate aldolase